MTQEPAPWLTVVTVVKDDPAGMLGTVTSLREQDMTGVEYVVVDSSGDPAPVQGALTGLDAQYSWTTPAGIYPAMNTGLATATGDYVYFLNAGDRLHAQDVLARVRTIAERTTPVWMYGEVEILEAGGSAVVTPRWDYRREQSTSFSNGHFPPHQGTFARRSALRAVGGFDPAYTIVADYAAFLQLSRLADPVYLDLIVATFVEGGVSTISWPESLRQFHRARRSILAPRGTAAAREYVGTVRQAVAMGLHRGIVSRLRRP